MAVRFTVYDRNGRMLAEIEPALESVSWRLNGVGRCDFSMSWDDPKCTKELLQFGNRLRVEFDNGLPDWGGVIDVPRRRTPGRVEPTAYTGEALLDWRVTAQNAVYDSKVPGFIFQDLITTENADWPTGIEVGAVFLGGEPRWREYHYHDVLARIQDLMRTTGHDFAVMPVYSDGKLWFQANFYEQRGQDRSGQVALIEGKNLVDAVYDEQGQIANRVIVVGEGTTWDEERLVAIEEDMESRDRYGYREYSEVQGTVSKPDTLIHNARAILEEKKEPRAVVTLWVTDEEPGRFGSYDVGDVVRAMLFVDSQEWGEDVSVRVIARRWDLSGMCRLEVEKWTS